MKYLFYPALISLSLISCGNNDNVTEDAGPIEKEVYQFDFKSYAVKETILYTGGTSGSKTFPQESFLSSYWSTYQQPAWKKIVLDLKNNSIQLIAGNSADAIYNINISNDSVLINDKVSKPRYIGDFNKKNSTFTLKRTLQYMKRERRDNGNVLTIVQNVSFGTTRYDDMFGILFTTPADMIKAEDQVLWSNIEYYYKQL
ncbi:hypothetical protein DRF59_17750 [Chryseobacterium flavum]|uniref:Uncharacterized protein n=1 Tax=Chryseobacterium flavum TaxID=415851 RepID=A0A3D9CH66_9FLAO|nr:hypothetical protein [Chryseobacterium flavum]REC65056.1 hypothetical protein DRF59_17750 [Chryseobacterium flavum]